MNAFQKKIVQAGLYDIELALERHVIEAVRQRQARVKGLSRGGFGYTATWGEGDMTPGCRDCCLKGRWTQVRTTTKCNLNCPFCYYFGQKDRHDRELIPRNVYMINGRFFDLDDAKMLIETQGEKFLNGIAWLHFEPLLELDKMLPLMEFVSHRGYHQWLYTNGVFASREALLQLSRAGLNEIRFNLAATNCSESVIENMAAAREHFEYLCIESPVYTGFVESLMKRRDRILATGVDHIHLAELQVFERTRKNFLSEGTLYRYKRGYVSPIRSRQLVYDIFDTAVREGWKGVVLHDCSNETKFYRGAVAHSPEHFGFLRYEKKLELGPWFYEDAVNHLESTEGNFTEVYRRLLGKKEKELTDPRQVIRASRGSPGRRAARTLYRSMRKVLSERL